MESAFLGWIAAHRVPALDGVMWALTTIGRGGAVWLVLAAGTALLDRRRAMAAWQVGLALLLAVTLSDGVLKPLVHRARPAVDLEASHLVGRPPTSSSFPSGHATTAAAGAAMLASVWPPARAAFWLLAIGIAVSRLYLGLHYPSDVAAGFLLGLLVAWFVRGRTRWRFLAPRRER
jgi:undecaprenyl-diphosphatase